MPSGLSFTLFGIPIRIDPSFFMIAVLWGLGERRVSLIVSWVVVVTLSVLAHELGHAITFKIFDRRPNIVLQWMGGLTFAPGVLTPARQLIVSLAGPLAGLLLIGLPAFAIAQGTLDDGSTWDVILSQVVWVNIVWSVFNLLPVLPLDGGHVCASALYFVVRERAMRIAHIISIAVAAAGGLYAITNPNYIFIALFAGFLAYWNFSQLSKARPQEDQREFYEGFKAIARSDFAEASRHAQQVIASGPDDPTLAAAVELDAWAKLYSADVAGARAALNGLPQGRVPNQFLVGSIAMVEGRTEDALGAFCSGFRMVQFGPWSPVAAALIARTGQVEPLLDRLAADDQVGVGAIVQFQSHLHYAQRFAEAARAGERAFMAAPAERGQVAYNVACDWALAGDADVAMAWLERAVAEGFASRSQIDDDPDLASLHSDGRYEALLAKLPGT
ncbi:MAG TPA: site-2 protease family protein [Acidimicrobiales bacterium]|nr:site-2 protease family protein [Acidimicrobiales bacterium]